RVPCTCPSPPLRDNEAEGSKSPPRRESRTAVCCRKILSLRTRCHSARNGAGQGTTNWARDRTPQLDKDRNRRQSGHCFWESRGGRRQQPVLRPTQATTRRARAPRTSRVPGPPAGRAVLFPELTFSPCIAPETFANPR